ncbi:MAG: hypothetical protein ABS63_08665 [Microbacterium sp. SCN 70-27]|uniref:hypothetical protein n=1 Tax=unclassified Microbacterium TaxID=2609290 RepID=UPI0008693EE0|nr:MULTISPECIES: hypothetical protein [unclassified Microbacterium]MBN9225470.1 hypothetical protein [Microbacterium sp.]ODT27390.1 MAG: hypothetical protein ABS63_08665 [Microbacterium sp. SCN 70-27]
MDFLLVALGAFLGAAGAFVSDMLLDRGRAIREEEAAVNDLLVDLSVKRALIIDRDAEWAPGASERVVESVMDARRLISEARRRLRPGSNLREPLRKMSLACATFLEQVEYQRDGATTAEVATLTQALRGQAATMRRLRGSKIVEDSPGDVHYTHTIKRR